MMILKRLTSFAALAASLWITAAAVAQTELNYEPNDLLMGFRATAGDGATKCYIVNLGPASTYVNATSSFVVPGLGNIKADLDATFPGWQTDAAVLWSVSAANNAGVTGTVDGEPVRTLFASKVQAVPGTPNTVRWNRASSATQASPALKMLQMADFYEFVVGSEPPPGVKNVSTANSPKAILQDTTDPNSYASYQPGGTPSNSGPTPGISFAYFNPTIEATFASGTAGSILELYRLRPASGGQIGTPGDFIGTFQLDDNANVTFTPTPTAQVALSSATYSGSESGGMITVTLTRTGDMSGSFSVNFSTADGTAIAGTDYTAQTNVPVNFAALDTSKTVDVVVASRPGFQGDRTFTVNLSGATNAAKILTPSSATVTIFESETGVKLESAAYTVDETAGNVAVKLVRVGPGAAFTATVNTTDGTAFAGTDYTGQTNVGVNFAIGDAEKTLLIPITNRPGIQTSRDFTVAITGTTNGVATGTPTTATVTINNVLNAGSVSFSSATYEQAEPPGGTVGLTITVNRTGASEGAVSVDVAATGGTAQSPDDYTLPASPVMLSWADGEGGARTFDITIKSDAVAEASAETILLALQNAQGGVTLGATNTATVTLPGEDSVAPTLTVTAPKNKAKITDEDVTFTGTAMDNSSVARVEVVLDTGAMATATPPAPTTSFAWAVTLAPEQGANIATITAYDAAGNASPSVMVNLTFTNLRPLLAGKYNGLLVSTAATDLFTRNGLVSLNVTATGKFTGKVIIAGATLPISGTFLTGDGSTATAVFGKLSTPTFELIKKAKPANISLGHLALAVDTAGGLEVTGTLSTAASGGTVLANIDADLAVYTAKKNPVLPLRNVPLTLSDPAREKGKYTGVLLPDAIVAGTPAGNGYGSVSISTAGVVKIVGKLADGSAISYSNALSAANHWPVFIQLYGKQGFIGGDVAFDPTQTLTDAAGALTWFKPAGLARQKLYPNGWPNGILSDFIASKFIASKAPTTKVPTPPNPDTVLGVGVPGAPNTTTANIEIALTDGALPADTSNDASIDAKSKVTVLGATAGSTAATGLKTTFVASSGAMSGNFTHSGTGRIVKFAGVAFQKTNSAFGHFLYFPALPATGESGAATVTKK